MMMRARLLRTGTGLMKNALRRNGSLGTKRRHAGRRTVEAGMSAETKRGNRGRNSVRLGRSGKREDRNQQNGENGHPVPHAGMILQVKWHGTLSSLVRCRRRGFRFRLWERK